MTFPTTFPKLETERLHLRQITPADVDDWFAALAQPDVHRYLVDMTLPVNHAHVLEIIGWTGKAFNEGSGARWAVTLKPSPVLIGTCGFHLYDLVHRRAEVGYDLSAAYWRQGIMSEALRAVMGYCFETLNVHRLEADVTAGNDASAGLLRKLGFRQEGTWRDQTYGRGRFHDMWQFGLLATDPRS
jgi:ribosomal-protein-alanine N-acetyltransferase